MSMKRISGSGRLHRWGTIIGALAAIGLAPAAVDAAILYVDAAVVGSSTNGTSWANAYTNLQPALTKATSTDEIWVAQGTYYPASKSEYLTLNAGAAIYGGFTNGMATRAERDWAAYPTVLSGDIDQNGLVDTNNHPRILTLNKNSTADGLTIVQGYSGDHAAGIFVSVQTNVTIRNCVVSGHYVRWYGGGIRVNASSVMIEDCTIANNMAYNGWGGGIYQKNGVLTIRGTLLRGNRAGEVNGQYNGGGLYMEGPSTTTVENCTFADNHARYAGGAVGMLWTVADKVTLTLRDSTFCGNTASFAGVLQSTVSSKGFLIENSIFCGNRAGGYSAQFGAVLADYIGTVRNCLFVGNESAYLGGAIYQGSPSGTQTIENCTFARNYAPSGPGAVGFNSTTGALKNCIFWGNLAESWATAKEIDCKNSTLTFAYSDFGAIYTNGATITYGAGNTNVNPLFAAGTNGAWTAAATYSSNASQSVLTHSGVGWTVNQWADCFVNPKTNQYRQFYVVSNDASTLTVWGDASALATNGAAYRIDDCHLQSKYGRYTALGWVNDAAGSSLIDAGDPDAAYTNEPYYNGGRIDMGAYGNTAQASKSQPPPPAGTILIVH